MLLNVLYGLELMKAMLKFRKGSWLILPKEEGRKQMNPSGGKFGKLKKLSQKSP